MVSHEEIEHIATLSRIKLQEGEVVSLQKDISNILAYVGQVSAVGGGATHSVPPHHNTMRDDAPRPAGDQLKGKEAALRAAFPTQEDNYNVVRKIIQKDE